ncbi:MULTISPECIES: transposase [Pseudooceanicola]|uniref:transposase n=1 Tax=Pseudooceanicola TaxID=1679449 RepID=UPI0035CB226C
MFLRFINEAHDFAEDDQVGLTPKPHSSGGKEKLGRISEMGNRDLLLLRLLYLGASCQRHASGVTGVIAARRRGQPGDDWLWKCLQRKTVKQAAIALANRMARTVWALLRNGTSYDTARAA